MRRVPQQHANLHVRRERDRRTFTRQAILLSACAVLAAGFIFAARQQIAAVQYGYKSEELRRERERLLEEQARLLLKIEESSSHANLERRARGLGLQPARAAQIGAGYRPAQTEAARELRDETKPDATRARGEEQKSRGRSDAARAASPAFTNPAALTRR